MEEIKKVFKHELLHLIAKDIHGPNFRRLAAAADTHVHCPSRPEPIIKKVDLNNKSN